VHKKKTVWGHFSQMLHVLWVTMNRSFSFTLSGQEQLSIGCAKCVEVDKLRRVRQLYELSWSTTSTFVHTNCPFSIPLAWQIASRTRTTWTSILLDHTVHGKDKMFLLFFNYYA